MADLPAGEVLSALLMGAGAVALGIPVGPRSLRALREEPPSHQTAVSRLTMRVVSAMVFLAGVFWFNSTEHPPAWVPVVEALGLCIFLAGEVGRYQLARRLRVKIADRPTSGGAPTAAPKSDIARGARGLCSR